MLSRLSLAGFVLLLLSVQDSFAQQGPRLFLDNEALNITLSFDFDSVYSEPCSAPAFHAGNLITGEGELDVKIRKRGKFRCEKSNCANPPLMIDFKKKKARKTVFNHQDKLKLVMPCRPGSKQYNECLYKEYLVYKLLNIITPMSLEVRFANLRLINTGGKHDTVVMPAFFVEDDDAMAVRNEGEIWKATGISASETNREHTTLIDLFQYMIGNTDWSATEPHNIELLSTGPFQPPYTVPYDFDWCGLVSAPYAFPDPKLQLANVRQRIYLGSCRSDEEWKAAFWKFRDKKEEMTGTIEHFPLLSQQSKKKMLRYLDDFWELVDDPPSGISTLNRMCRKENNP